jgi:DUF4097 and DUF4098 domain-containing protein YvlB
MIFRMFLASALLFTGSALIPTAAHAADFDRTLNVSGPAELNLSTGSGRVHIVPGNDSSIHIHAHLYAGWNMGGDVEERIRRIAANPPIQQSGNSIRVGDTGNDRALFNNISIDYEISAPRSIALGLHTGSGDIEVDNLGRFLKADSGSGSVRVHGLSGPADLHTGSGDVELQDQGAGDVHASTGSGSIRINGLNGGFTASTGSGDIEAGGRITSASKIKTGSGSVRLHLGHEARVTLDAATGSGSVRVPGNGGGDRHRVNEPLNGGGPVVEIHTGSGDIEVN